ncbi:MAG: hypothetical protein GY893_12800, partial [bacterium]|nr:hypothetical protein [bacterium]
DGESLSAAFTTQYLNSFKYPYWLHHLFGKFFVWLDLFGDALAKLKIFRLVLMMLKLLGISWAFRAMARRITGGVGKLNA